jgi:hypothetical protein
MVNEIPPHIRKVATNQQIKHLLILPQKQLNTRMVPHLPNNTNLHLTRMIVIMRNPQNLPHQLRLPKRRLLLSFRTSPVLTRMIPIKRNLPKLQYPKNQSKRRRALLFQLIYKASLILTRTIQITRKPENLPKRRMLPVLISKLAIRLTRSPPNQQKKKEWI